MIGTYEQAKRYLESFIPQPGDWQKNYQLTRIKKIGELLGNPQNRYPIIHVGGTSGKGSTATFAATILKELGLKVGLHLSPHVQEVRERMQINAKLIPRQRFTELVNQLTSIIRRIEVMSLGQPTYFELLVAMTFLYFAQSRVDAAVIEVGLGGTLDATNIIPPSLALLTNVSLDHTTILGNTVTKIAEDKMGIIKTGSPGVVSGITQPLLRSVLEKHCHQLGVPLYLIHRAFELRPERPKLLGEFQRVNFTLATKAAEIFVAVNFPEKLLTLESAIKKTANNAFIPGRLERVNQNPLVILDGAHNSAKMHALVTSLRHLYPKQKWIAVVAIKQNKQYKAIVRRLDPIVKKYIFTTFRSATDRGVYPATDPVILIRSTQIPAGMRTTALSAVTYAIKLSQTMKLPILITGSLYLVGEIRNKWYPVKSQ